MQQDYNNKKDPFQIGDEFENFVENKIFMKDRYALIHRTSSKKDNEERYPESASKPDFHFRCLETGKEFYVEAKYRSSAIENKVEGLKKNQELRFKKLREELPIFVIIGYWGTPANPSKLSLLTLEECKYRFLFTYYLRNFEIKNEPYPNHLLNLKSETQSNEQETKENRKSANNIKPSKKIKTNPKILILAAIGLLAIIISIYGYGFSVEPPEKTPEETLEEIVADYYQSMNSNKIEKLPEFLSQEVRSWYGTPNMPLEQIMKDAKAHRGKYPFSDSDIDWDSFKVVAQENGEYYVTYRMVYKSKQKITDEYQVFNLNLITHWDENFRLKSIREIRL